jgi:hypothetical protein
MQGKSENRGVCFVFPLLICSLAPTAVFPVTLSTISPPVTDIAIQALPMSDRVSGSGNILGTGMEK